MEKQCENGCDAPICPPSKVICRACIDRITATLERISDVMAEDADRRASLEHDRREEQGLDRWRGLDSDE